MSTIVHKVQKLLEQRLKDGQDDNSTIDQLMTDLAVIILSNMRPHEIDAALYMALGQEGVSELLYMAILARKEAHQH